MGERAPVGGDAVVLRETEAWFERNGLTYFVPAQRSAVRDGLRARRVVPFVLGTLLVVGAVAVGLDLLVDDDGLAVAAALSLGVGTALVYVATALRAGSIIGWALGHTFGSVRLLLPIASRALPLLLVFIAFLFINAEAWQMTSALSFGQLWVAVLLLTGFAVLFLLVRLPEEVDEVDDAVDDVFLRRTCRGTPVEDACTELVADHDTDPAAHAQVTGYERWNLILVLLVVQVGQVLLLTVTVFAFLVLFGSLVVSEPVQLGWTTLNRLHNAPFLPSSVSAELAKVSLFLAGFSGLYFTISAVTDETYRSQFFATVTAELEQAVGVRAVYLAMRAG